MSNMRITDYYSDIKRLGAGSFSAIFSAIDNSDNRSVVLKQIGGDDIEKEDYSEGTRNIIQREINVLKRVSNSKQIVQYIKFETLKSDDPGDYREYYYLVFERLHSDLSYNMKRLGCDRIKLLLFQVCKGLAYIHGQSVLHRDIKPANLLVDQNLEILKIADLGLGRTFGTTFSEHTPNIGTVMYMAPEILLRSPSYGPEVDIWSAGCVFAEMATGEAIFPRDPYSSGSQHVDQMRAIVSKLGSPTEEMWPGARTMINWRPEFEGIPPKDLETEFGNILGIDGVDLLSRMLTYNPEMRISATEAMEHSFFDSVDKSIYAEDDDDEDEDED